MDESQEPPDFESISGLFRSQGVDMTDDEIVAVQAMIGGIWPLVQRMRAVPLPYEGAQEPGLVWDWIANGGRERPDAA